MTLDTVQVVIVTKPHPPAGQLVVVEAALGVDTPFLLSLVFTPGAATLAVSGVPLTHLLCSRQLGGGGGGGGGKEMSNTHIATTVTREEPSHHLPGIHTGFPAGGDRAAIVG